MKNGILVLFVLMGFSLTQTSCVTKKKYAELQKFSDLKTTQLYAAVDSLTQKNDSLVFMLAQKDSILDSLNLRLAEFQKKENPKLKIKEYSRKKSTLSKEQEYEKKAVFIYNFARYIEWPVEYNGTEFVIGVAADADVIALLQKYMADKKAAGKKIVIKPYTKGPKYNLVYVTSAKAGQMGGVLKNETRSKTVIVSDEGRKQNIDGSHVSFIIDSNKIRYFVNKSAIEAKGLKVAQELMRYAG